MGLFRPPLRALVRVWLFWQLTCLAAFVPLVCCAGEHQPASAAPKCHQKIAAKQCPMRAADGTPCPMHRDVPAVPTLVLRGICQPLDAALATILLQPAVPRAAAESLPNLTLVQTLHRVEPQPTRLCSPPDPPPPRA